MSSRGLTPSSRGDTSRSRLDLRSGSGRSRLGTRAAPSRTTSGARLGVRSGSGRTTGSRFGSTTRSRTSAANLPRSNRDARRAGLASSRSRFGTRAPRSGLVSSRSRFGASRTTGLRSGGGIGTRSATGSVRTRVGTRSGRVGRSYRIHSHRRHHHGHHHGHRPHFGFYYSWYPWAYPHYYRAYPRYGLYFGYGISYYGPAYETVFVESTPYYPTEVIVREEVIQEEVIEEAPAVELHGGAAPVQPAPGPAADGDFPAPQPQGQDAPGADAPQPHADFEPAVEDFLAGRYRQALQRLDRVLLDEPDNGEAWLAAMHANFALGRYGRAANALAKAAALDAFPRGYRFDPRPLYSKSGNYDSLVKALDVHIASNPKDADAVLVRAYLHVASAERAQAQDMIQTALRLRPADETAPALALALLPPPPPPKAEGRAK